MQFLKILLTFLTGANLALSVHILANRPEAYTLVYYFGDILSVAAIVFAWAYRYASPEKTRSVS